MTNHTITDNLESIAAEVVDERLNQIEKWGDRAGEAAGIPLVFGETARLSFAEQADYWKQVNAARVAEDCLSWDGILLEEVFELLAEPDLLAGRVEAIQVSAVGQAIVEAIDNQIDVLTDELLDKSNQSELDEIADALAELGDE